MAVKIEKAATAIVRKGKNDKCNCRNRKNDYYDRWKRIIVATSVEKKVMAADVIKEKGKVMDNATVKEKEKVMDIDAIKEGKEIRDDKEKSKYVFQQKCEDLNLDCIHDNSLLGFEKPMPLGFKTLTFSIKHESSFQADWLKWVSTLDRYLEQNIKHSWAKYSSTIDHSGCARLFHFSLNQEKEQVRYP